MLFIFMARYKVCYYVHTSCIMRLPFNTKYANKWHTKPPLRGRNILELVCESVFSSVVTVKKNYHSRSGI